MVVGIQCQLKYLDRRKEEKMANKYCNLQGSSKIKDTYTDINVGFNKVETDVTNLDNAVNLEISNRQNADAALHTRIDNIVNNPDSGKDAEIVDARNSYSTLKARLDTEHQTAIFDRLRQQLVCNELSRIVTDPANIRALVFFDENGAVNTLKDRANSNRQAYLSANASQLSPDIAGNARVLNFTSSATWELESESNDLSFTDVAGNDLPFSLVWCGSLNGTGRLIAKNNQTTENPNQEYEFFVDGSNLLNFRLRNKDNAHYIGRRCSNSVTADVGTFTTYIGTYDASKSVGGIKIYRRGIRVDDTDSTVGSYSGQTATNARVGNYNISSGGTKTTIGNYKGAVIAIIAEELSAEQVKQIDAVLRSYCGVDAVTI